MLTYNSTCKKHQNRAINQFTILVYSSLNYNETNVCLNNDNKYESEVYIIIYYVLLYCSD